MGERCIRMFFLKTHVYIIKGSSAHCKLLNHRFGCLGKGLNGNTDAVAAAGCLREYSKSIAIWVFRVTLERDGESVARAIITVLQSEIFAAGNYR